VCDLKRVVDLLGQVPQPTSVLESPGMHGEYDCAVGVADVQVAPNVRHASERGPDVLIQRHPVVRLLVIVLVPDPNHDQTSNMRHPYAKPLAGCIRQARNIPGGHDVLGAGRGGSQDLKVDAEGGDVYPDPQLQLVRARHITESKKEGVRRAGRQHIGTDNGDHIPVDDVLATSTVQDVVLRTARAGNHVDGNSGIARHHVQQSGSVTEPQSRVGVGDKLPVIHDGTIQFVLPQPPGLRVRSRSVAPVPAGQQLGLCPDYLALEGGSKLRRSVLH
jgi:hypothetical protein